MRQKHGQIALRDHGFCGSAKDTFVPAAAPISAHHDQIGGCAVWALQRQEGNFYCVPLGC